MMNFFLNKTVLNRRSDVVFDSIRNMIDEKAFSQLKTQGFTVLPFLNPDEVNFMGERLNIFLGSFQNSSIGELFYTSGRDGVNKRLLARELTWPVIEPLLNRIVNLEFVDADGGAWLLKPSSDQSSLSPHQDSSLIDETKIASFYGWIPIQDTTKNNGCIFVLPGSHLWGNHYRSLDVPWMFNDFTDLLVQYSVPIEMKAGEILLFDTALIHGSYPNLSNNIRAAINLFFRPRHSYMTHHCKFDDTPKGKIEEYKIDIDFFFKEDFRKRPNSDKFLFMGYKNEVIKRKLSKRQLIKMCESKSNN